MRRSSFKKELERVLLAVGFTRAGKSYRREGVGVSTLVSFAKGFGDSWFVNVGFWLHALGGDEPDRVESTHLCYRLERLFPDFRETILAAGAMDDPGQPRAYAELVRLFSTVIDSSLRSLASEEELRAALRENRLKNGLVRKEARDFLSSVTE